MSKQVDERVVQMRFDNKQFEENAQASIKTLDNLKRGLNLEGSAKGLQELDKASRGFSMASLASGVESVASRFSNLGIIGMTALQNITNSAINAGKSLVSSLTIDPVKMGFQEYETKMGSIQTILTNTAHAGTTIDQVNNVLNELNKYADQTIYNFSEMTRNIGTFTAAGIDLDTSAMAIKGIANLAAGSGSSAEQASTAMYQLSQALAAGKVGLQDWNSVVNAGMGGKLFQNALEKTANELGRGRDMSVSFRESLQDGWITTDVLTKTLQKFAEDESLLKAATQVKTFTQLIDTMKESVQSGWAQSWELIIGDKDEAAKMLTAVNNAFGSMIGKSADARNEMLSFWKANGGRDAIINGIAHAFEALQSVLKPIGQAFRDIFPPMTGQRLVDISNGFMNLMEKFKMGEATSEKIRVTFKGLFSIFDMGLKVIKMAAGGIGELFKRLAPGSDSLLSITASIGEYITSANNFIDKNDLVGTSIALMGKAFDSLKVYAKQALDTLGPVLSKIKSVIEEFSIYLSEIFFGKKVLAKGFSNTSEVFANTGEETNKIRLAFEKFKDVLEGIVKVIVKVATAVKNFLTPIIDSIKKKFDELTTEDMGAIAIGAGLLMFAKTLTKGIDSINSVVENFAGVLEEVGNSLKAFQLKIKAGALLKIAIAVGILAAALMLLTFIDMAKLAKGLTAMTILFAELIVALKILNKKDDETEIKKIAGQMIGLGIGLLLLAFAVKVLSSMDLAGLAKGVGAVTILLGAITGFSHFFKDGDFKQSTAGLIAFSIGLLILSKSIKTLGDMDLVKLGKGLGSVIILMGAIGGFGKLFATGDFKKSTAGLIAFSIGLLILTKSIEILGKMDLTQLVQGGVALAGIMGGLAAFIALTKAGDLSASAGGLIAFSIGIAGLVGSMILLGNMDPIKLAQAGYALLGIGVGLMAFINLTKAGDLSASAGGLITFAIGVGALILCLQSLGKMDPKSLIQGGIALGVLGAGIFALIKFTSAGDLVGSSAGIIGFAIGLNILVYALKTLSSIDADALDRSMEAMKKVIWGLILFIKATNGKSLKDSASGMIGFALGLIVLTGAIIILSKVDPDGLMRGVTAISALLFVLGTFIKMTKEGDLKESAKGLIGFSVGLMVLAGVIAILSALDPAKLLMSSVAISALMMSIATFVNLTKEGDLKASSKALVVFSVAIGILAASLVAVGQLDTGKIIAAGLAITAILLSIVAFVKLTKGADLVAGALSLILFSGAIMVLSMALSQLGSLEISTLIIGIGALVAVFVILGVSATILAPLTPVIIALTAAIALFGVACLAIGVGMLEFARGLDLLAISGSAGAAVLIVAVQNIIALIPLAMTTLAVGIINFARTIGDGATTIAEAFMKVFKAILDTVVTMMPELVNAGMELIAGILRGIADNIQQVVEAGIDIILNFINGVNSKLPAIIDTAFDLIITFINGLADAINRSHTDVYGAVSNLVSAIIDALVGFIPNMMSIGGDLVAGFIDGMSGMIGSVVEKAQELARKAVNAVKSLLDINSPSRVFAELGEFSAIGFAGGMDAFAGMAEDSAENVGIGAVDSLRGAIAHVSDVVNGNIDMVPTIRPVIDLSAVTSGVGAIDSMLNANRGITLASQSAKLSSISSGMQPDQYGLQNGNIVPAIIDGFRDVVQNDMGSAMDLSGVLTVQVANDKGEIIGIAQSAIRDLLRRESR